MAKNKSARINRLSAPLKKQTKLEQEQETILEIKKNLNEIRDKKWLNLILSGYSMQIVAEESYKMFKDTTTVSSSKLPTVAKNVLIQLERKGKEIDKLIDTLSLTFKQEVGDSKFTKDFFENASYAIHDNNTDIQMEFLKMLLTKLDAGRIETYMSALTEEYKKGWPLLLRADLRIFFVKTNKTTDYIPMNIMGIEEMSFKLEIEDLKYFDSLKGTTKKVTKAMLKKLHAIPGYEGLNLEWIDNNLKNIK